MSKYDKVLSDVLEEIRPADSDLKRMNKVAEDIVDKLGSKNVRSFVGGSLAKGTVVKKENQDIDIFVLFDSEEKTKDLGRMLEKKGFNFEVVHGSRDYYHIGLDGFLVEVIPVVGAKDLGEANNVTDVSLTHVDYVKKKIRKDKKLADEIRLAKAFCQAQRVYGAESYIKGFSGYALEVLVIHFGSFVGFLKGLNKRSGSDFIDSEKYFKNKQEAFREINESKLVSPIVVVDPTYRYRNVVAGLGYETYEVFLKSAKDFLKKPSFDFFERKEIDVGSMKNLGEKKGNGFLEFVFRTDRQEGDIAGTKMRKFFDFVCSHLEEKGQGILEKEFYYSGEGKEAKGYVVIKRQEEIEVEGPPLKMKEAAKNFRKSRNKVYEKKGKLYVREKVSLKNLFSVVKQFENDMGVQFEVV